MGVGICRHHNSSEGGITPCCCLHALQVFCLHNAHCAYTFVHIRLYCMSLILYGMVECHAAANMHCAYSACTLCVSVHYITLHCMSHTCRTAWWHAMLPMCHPALMCYVCIHCMSYMNCNMLMHKSIFCTSTMRIEISQKCATLILCHAVNLNVAFVLSLHSLIFLHELFVCCHHIEAMLGKRRVEGTIWVRRKGEFRRMCRRERGERVWCIYVPC